jgi:hypothetical protein
MKNDLGHDVGPLSLFTIGSDQFQLWLYGLEWAAQRGTAALAKAWHTSPKSLRAGFTTKTPLIWEALKLMAAKKDAESVVYK